MKRHHLRDTKSTVSRWEKWNDLFKRMKKEKKRKNVAVLSHHGRPRLGLGRPATAMALFPFSPLPAPI